MTFVTVGQNLLPWIAIIPGILNVLVAHEEFARKTNPDVLTNPYRKLGFWFWLILEFTLPTSLFYWYFFVATKPPSPVTLVFIAILSGFIFAVLLNADLKIAGNLPIPLKGFHDFLLDRVNNLFVRDMREGRINAEFWRDIKRYLSNTNFRDDATYITDGLKELEVIFERIDRFQSKKLAGFKYQEKLAIARNIKEEDTKRAKSIGELLYELCRIRGKKVFFEALRSFHLKDEFWQKYQNKISRKFLPAGIRTGRDR